MNQNSQNFLNIFLIYINYKTKNMIMKNIKLFEDFNENTKAKWKIYAGLGGGFGGARFVKTFFGTKERAESEAYQAAIEEYESYEGLHGLRTIEEIMEDDNVDEDEARVIYNDEMESWLDYYVKPDDGIKESNENEIEVKFVGKRNHTQAFNVYKTRDGKITRIEKPNHVHIRFPFNVGEYLNKSVEEWACNNNFYIDGKDTCPEEKVFGIRKKDIPQGHELRTLFTNKFR